MLFHAAYASSLPCGVVGNTVGFHRATPGSFPSKGASFLFSGGGEGLDASFFVFWGRVRLSEWQGVLPLAAFCILFNQVSSIV